MRVKTLIRLMSQYVAENSINSKLDVTIRVGSLRFVGICLCTTDGFTFLILL